MNSEDYVIEIPQKLSELKAARQKLASAGQENSSSVEYIDQLLEDVRNGLVKPASEA